MNRVFASFILLFLSIILIISGLSLNFFYGYKEDKVESNALISSIDKYYKVIQDNLEEVRPYMASMNDFFSLYYEEADLKKGEYESVMLEIDSLKKVIDSNYVSMIDICDKNVVDVSEKKCDSIIDSYSSFSVTYSSLIETYNNFIEQCNIWKNNNA